MDDLRVELNQPRFWLQLGLCLAKGDKKGLIWAKQNNDLGFAVSYNFSLLLPSKATLVSSEID